MFKALGIMSQGRNVLNVAQKLNIVMQPAFSNTHTLFNRPEHQFYERKGVLNYGQAR